MPKATQHDTCEELETALSRPDAILLQQQILQIVTTENNPTTAETILTKLKESDQFNVYMSDIAKTIWRMVSNGLIVVESGKIQVGDQPRDNGGDRKAAGRRAVRRHKDSRVAPHEKSTSTEDRVPA